MQQLTRYRRAVLVLLVVILTAGCQVQAQVKVKVNEDGSGTVEVAVALDPEAVSQLPDLDRNGTSDPADLTQLVRVDDLKAAGWKLKTEPIKVEDGSVGAMMTATKPFGTPEEAAAILDELSSQSAGFRDLKVERKNSFATSKYSFSGMIDLKGGLEAFGDEGLAKVLDGRPLGQDVKAIEQRYGKPVADMLQLSVKVELPGGKSKTWKPVLGGDPLRMSAQSTVRDRIVLGLAVLAISCLLALAVVLLTRRRSSS